MFNLNSKTKFFISLFLFCITVIIFPNFYIFIINDIIINNFSDFYKTVIHLKFRRAIFLLKYYYCINFNFFNLFEYELYMKIIVFYIMNSNRLEILFLYLVPTSYIYISIIVIHIFLLVLTIWTRACGPRVRIDQIMTLTWKEFLINLFFLIILILFVFIFF